VAHGGGDITITKSLAEEGKRMGKKIGCAREQRERVVSLEKTEELGDTTMYSDVNLMRKHVPRGRLASSQKKKKKRGKFSGKGRRKRYGYRLGEHGQLQDQFVARGCPRTFPARPQSFNPDCECLLTIPRKRGRDITRQFKFAGESGRSKKGPRKFDAVNSHQSTKAIDMDLSWTKTRKVR